MFYFQQRVRIRIILSLSFALQHMLNVNSAVLPVEVEAAGLEPQQEDLPYDFSSCQRLKKLTTHDIYRFTHNEEPLVVKLFAPQALPNYRTELESLQRAHHSSILRVLYHRPSVNIHSAEPLTHSHLIVLHEATRGDLNDYLPRYGRMSQKMARTYFKELVESLQALSELKPPLVHPNLLASNLLLTDEGRLQVCGWSEISSRGEEERLKQNIFSCGQILICLLTSFMPFYKKYSPTDSYYKFLSQDHIHKFWQEMQKKMIKIDKKFAFSTEVKDLLESIFLRRFTKFTELLNHQWTQGEVFTLPERIKVLQQNEKSKNEKLQSRKKQQTINEQKKRKALHDYQLSFGLHRSSTLEENSQFIKDCEQNIIREEDIPLSEPLSCMKIEATPSFLIASLKDFLRHENGKCSVMLCSQFILNNHKVVKKNNYVKIDLDFALGDLEQQDELLDEKQQETVSLQLKLTFTRQDKDIFADVQVLQSNFNAYYTNLALHFIEDRIQKRKETSK